MKRHLAAINDLRMKIKAISRGFNPFRQLTVTKPDPICQNKSCKGSGKATVWINYNTHFVCDACSCVRTKYEQGLDQRNIKEREQLQGDANSSNYHTLDPLLSDSVNRQTVIGIAPGAMDKKGKRMSSRNINAWNRRMYKKDIDEIERQIIRAKELIENIGDDLFLNSSVKRKAYVTFCSFIRCKGDLPRENEVIAACLIESLPPIPKIYPKKKKRPSTPYNDSKQKRLKFMTFTRPASKSI